MSAAEHGSRPEPPVGDTPPAQLGDEALSAELRALDDYQHGPGGGRAVPWEILRQIGNRRGALTREQTRREHERAKAARAAAEHERLLARQARTRIGRRDADGRRPVAVDGRPCGQVWRSGHGRDWWCLVDGAQQRTLWGSQWEAADAVVQAVDAREAAAVQRQRRAAAPPGWVAAAAGEVFEVLDVVRLAGPENGPAWGRPWRVTGREEHRDGRVSFRLELADVDRPSEGTVLFGDRLPRFARPSATALAELPPAPFRVLHPEEYTERRLLNVGDELSSLSRVEGCAEAARRALVLLAGVEEGRSADPAADMGEIAGLAEELARIVSDPAHPDAWSGRYDRANAEHAARWARRASGRFAEGGRALAKEYREWLHQPH